MGKKIQGDLVKLHNIVLAANEVACLDWAEHGLTQKQLDAILALRVAIVEFTGREIKPC